MDYCLKTEMSNIFINTVNKNISKIMSKENNKEYTIETPISNCPFGLENNTYKFGTGMATVVNQNGDLYSYVVSGYSSSTSAVNFIRVYTLAGGNLDDGSISLYGFSE